MYLSKDAITAGLQRAEADFVCPALQDGTVRIREISVHERQESAKAATTTAADGSTTVNTDIWHAELVRHGLIDTETHRPLYTADEIEMLRHANPQAIFEIAQAIYDLSEVGPAHLKSSDSPPDAG